MQHFFAGYPVPFILHPSMLFNNLSIERVRVHLGLFIHVGVGVGVCLHFLCNMGCGQFIYISKRLTCSPITSITRTHIYTHMHIHCHRQGQRRNTPTCTCIYAKHSGAVQPQSCTQKSEKLLRKYGTFKDLEVLHQS